MVISLGCFWGFRTISNTLKICFRIVIYVSNIWRRKFNILLIYVNVVFNNILCVYRSTYMNVVICRFIYRCNYSLHSLPPINQYKNRGYPLIGRPVDVPINCLNLVKTYLYFGLNLFIFYIDCETSSLNLY